MFGLRRRIFLVQKFIHMMMATRVFTTHLLPLQVFVTIIVASFFFKYFKQGFTPTIFLLLPILALQVFAELYANVTLQYVSTVLAGILHFMPLNMYWLPSLGTLVGFREKQIDCKEKKLNYFEFYPLKQDQMLTQKPIKWNYSVQLDKMLENQRVSNKFLKKIGHLALSYANKHQLKIGQGEQAPAETCIAFSHGRGGTPFIYSSLLLPLAARYKIGAVQHNQTLRPNCKSKEQFKDFRENQVKERAQELTKVIKHLKTSRLILMGHSYGCATAIQAYHNLQTQLKSLVSHLILLDPWLFPLPPNIFQKQFDCQVLVLANEDFIMLPDVYERNSQFISIHGNIQYIVWKNAHHLHQTDMGFIAGNLLGAVKNSHLSKRMLQLNLQAIEKFLKDENLQHTFVQKNLGPNFKPAKFHPDTFSY